jgi:hypothetical protein
VPVDRTELAWAAGLFDAEGTTSLSQGRYLRAALPQKGATGVPEVLIRFRRAVGVGQIYGPTKLLVYQWVTTSPVKSVQAIAALWPWLSSVKRAQALRGATADQTDAIERGQSTSPCPSRDESLAWAAGLFAGDGCLGVEKRKLRLGTRYSLRMSVGQSGQTEPEVLRKFQDLMCVGRITGPKVIERTEPQYSWYVCARPLIEQCMSLIWPWLDAVKRNQYENGLALLEALPPPHHIGRPGWRKPRCLRGHDYSQVYEWDGVRNGRPFHGRNCMQCHRERRAARKRAATLARLPKA